MGLSMEKLLTAGQVAEILNVSTAWVYDHADRKRPRFRPCGWERRYGSGRVISRNSLKR